jgi:hypothetical protein
MNTKEIGDEVWFTEGYNIGRGKVIGIHTDIVQYPISGTIHTRTTYDIDGLYDNDIPSGVVHKDVVFVYESEDDAKKSFSL